MSGTSWVKSGLARVASSPVSSGAVTRIHAPRLLASGCLEELGLGRPRGGKKDVEAQGASSGRDRREAVGAVYGHEHCLPE